MRIKIYHGLYDSLFGKILFRNTYKDIQMPLKFITLLKQKSWKWNYKKKLDYTLIPFTVGVDRDWDIWAIAIKDPRDEFSLKIGENAVKGRIYRQRGVFAPQRFEYNRFTTELPVYIKAPHIQTNEETIIEKENLRIERSLK